MVELLEEVILPMVAILHPWLPAAHGEVRIIILQHADVMWLQGKAQVRYM